MQKETIRRLTQELSDMKELLQTLSYLDTASHAKPQLLIDISGIKRYDSKTGIPRVVKNQIKHLKQSAQEYFEVKTIYLSEHPTHPLHFYHESASPIALAPADIIYNPDLDPKSVEEAHAHALYRCYKHIGVKIVTLIHDILPITNPEYFVKGQDTIHAQWLNNIVDISDLLITTTHATLDTLKRHLPQLPLTSVIPLGVDPLEPLSADVPQRAANNFLVVSTLEPRKGHWQLLDAFEILWHEHKDFTLTLVGKKGWNVEPLMERIANHPMLHKNLFYKEFVSDEELIRLYKTSSALIVASYAEGFGLPLIEASHYGLPLIVRDIPVFRETAKEHALYFPNTSDAESLSEAIARWNDLYEKDAHPKSIDISYNTWEQNVHMLTALLRS